MFSPIDPRFAPTEFESADAAAARPARGVLPALLQKLGIGAARRSDELEPDLPDRRALLAQAARRLRGGKGAFVLFDFSDVLELRSIYGTHAHQLAMRRVVQAMEELAGIGGIAARTGPAQFTVLLPGLDRGQAIDAAHATLGCPCRIELEIQRDEVVLVPDVVVDVCASADRADIEALYLRLSVTLARHRDHEVRRLDRMRRERERHSQPASLSG